MMGFSIFDFRSALLAESTSFGSAVASKASPSKQAGQLPAGPSPESFAPHFGHVFTAGISRSLEWAPPVTAQKLENGYIQSRRTRETGHDFDVTHWTMNPPLTPPRRGIGTTRTNACSPLGGRGWVVSWKAA